MSSAGTVSEEAVERAVTPADTGAPEGAAGAPRDEETSIERPAAGERRGRRRRRAGRFRRFILRPLVWGLTLIAILIFLLQTILDTSYARKWASELVAERLGQVLDREVSIADISLTLLPLSVQVWGLRIDGPEELPGDVPFLEVPWAAVDADLQALQQNVLRLQQIRVERPRVYMQFFPEGVSNVLRFHREGRERRRTRRFDVYVEHVEVERAEVLLDEESVQLSVAADAVRARFQGKGHLHVEGGVTAQDVVVRFPNARPITVDVSGEGSIERGRVEIESARATGDGVAATGSGLCEWPLDDVANKKCEFRIRGHTSGEKLAEIGYFRYLEGGVDVDGTLSWRPQVFGWRSRITAPRLAIWGRQLDKVEGVLSADRHKVWLDLEQARYGGGMIEGAIEVATKQEGRPLAVDLDFRGVQLDRLLADQRIPAGPLAARASGHVVYRCPLKEGRRGSGRAEVTVLADRDLAGLALAGSFPLRIDEGVVRVDSAVLAAQRQSVLARGYFDVDKLRGRFDYEVETADVAPLVAALRLVEPGEPWPRWLPTAGEGRLEGALYLVPGRPATDVAVHLAKVLGTDVRTPHVLNGDFHVDGRGLDRLSLELAERTGERNSALRIHGRVPFGDAGADPDAFRMVFRAEDWPLDSVRPWIDFELPVGGRISGSLDLRVADEGSDGRLQGVVTPATFYGVPLDAVVGRLDWNPERLRFDRLTLRAPAGEAEGRGTLEWASAEGAGDESLQLDLAAPALEIGAAPIRRWVPRAGLAGEVALTARLRGSRERPSLELLVTADRLAVGQRVLEGRPSELDIKWADGKVAASGRLLDMVTVDGGGVLDDGGGEIVLDLDGNDVAGLLELLYEAPPAGVDGDFGGRLRVTGALGDEKRIELELERMEVDYRGRRLANLEPVVLRLHPDHLEVGSLYLGEPATGSELFLVGTMGYGAGAPLDLRLQSTLANNWLRLYQPGVRADGYLDLLGRIGGTVDRPFFDGQGVIREASVAFESLPEFPHTCDDVSGVLLFYPDSVVIDHLEASLAGGRVKVEGRSAVPRAGAPASYRLQLAGRDLRLRYPEGWLVEGDAELTLATLEPGAAESESAEAGYLLAGRVDLRDLEYTQDVPVGFAQVVQSALLRRRLEVDPADRLLSSVHLNVQVEGPEALRVRNNLADLAGSVDVDLRGNAAQPVVLGEVELDPGGKLVYSSVDYEIERGSLSFASPQGFDPEVDLVATTRVRDFDVILTLSGTMERLDAGFASEPPLPALEVFELLATGGDEELEANPVRRTQEIGQDQSMSAASFLYGQAAEVIGERVSNLFGFDKFRIAPLTGSGDNLSKARVTVGKRLSKDFFVSYSADPTSTEEQRLQIEWQIGGGLVLVLTQNGDNTYEADARWETSF